jgi:prepilin signal peptidase PulO-like enzyme (type II secretory pathway)
LLALRKADRNSRMPFLPFLAAGYILYLLFD